MKKTIIETITVIITAVLAALIFNSVSSDRIDIFSRFQPDAGVSPDIHFEQIDIELFKYYMAEKGTIILDARSPEEFLSGHIPGAHSFNVGDFDSTFKERGEFLKLGELIIVYCSGPACNDAEILAIKLAAKGIGSIFIFSGGMEEWESSGNRIIQGNGK